MLKIAHGKTGDTIDKSVVDEVQAKFQELFEVDTCANLTGKQISDALQPDTMFERFKARKAVGVAGGKEFLSVKGTVAQTEGKLATDDTRVGHPQVRFKCLSYSVAESSGSVDIMLQKVVRGTEFTVGVRTVEDTAKATSEFEQVDKILTFRREQSEQVIQVQIFDNNEWQPDLEFLLELYDPNT